MNANREDKIVYVKAPIGFKSIVSEAFEKVLLEMGMEDVVSGNSTTKAMVMLSMKYWAINMTKKIFVGTHKNYGNPVITTEEFEHQYRGTILTKKFGI
jgi:hypothetical protein